MTYLVVLVVAGGNLLTATHAFPLRATCEAMAKAMRTEQRLAFCISPPRPETKETTAK